MRLNNEQIERYSRQLILAEVGPLGQERLLGARVAVVGTGVAAERAVAYLAAAGVGWIAADASVRAFVDPDQADVTFTTLADRMPDGVDALLVVATTIDDAAATLARDEVRVPAAFWIADGRAGAVPPCPRCAAAASPAPAVPTELVALRDAFLGAAIATEVVKTLLGIGTLFAGRVLAYDPATATVTTRDASADPGCT